MTATSRSSCIIVTAAVELAVEMKEITPLGALAHAKLRSWMNPEYGDTAWPSAQTLADKFGVTEKTMRVQLKKLVSLGFAYRYDLRHDKPPRYRVVDKPGDWSTSWGELPVSTVENGQRWREKVELFNAANTVLELNEQQEPPVGDIFESGAVKITGPSGKNYRTPPVKITDNIDLLDIDLNTKGKTRVSELPDGSSDATNRTTVEASNVPLKAQHPEAYELCLLLADQMKQRSDLFGSGQPERQVTDRWIKSMQQLIKLGGKGNKRPKKSDQPVLEPQRIRRVIETLFDWFAEPTGNTDFCWGSVIQSPDGLRKHWNRIADDLNRERLRRSGKQKPRQQAPTGNEFTDMSDEESTRLAMEYAKRSRARKGRNGSPIDPEALALTSGGES